MAESLTIADGLWAPRVCIYTAKRCLSSLPIIPHRRAVSSPFVLSLRASISCGADQLCSLRKEVVRLNPSRFEIGPVYTTNPRDRKTLRKSSNFRPLSKELVFDIDLTDYDEIRTCCDKANICHRCWSFVTMSIKVVDAALRQDFGFKHVLWVYSGRRGAHAWICDKRARTMDDRKRKAIAGYLEVIKGGTQSGKKVNVKRPLHPHLRSDFTRV